MTTIKFRRDTSANWTSVNPIPAQGEPCYETDTGKLKIGNGSDNYVTLPYVSDGGAASLPIASTTTLGAIKVGDNLTITADGTLSASGGSTGTTDYTQLENKPQINSVELTGNKTLNDLGIQPKGNYLTALPDNAVTTDTDQIISGAKSFSARANFNNGCNFNSSSYSDNYFTKGLRTGNVGIYNTNGNELCIQGSSTRFLKFDDDNIIFMPSNGAQGMKIADGVITTAPNNPYLKIKERSDYNNTHNLEINCDTTNNNNWSIACGDQTFINTANIDTTYMKWDSTNKKLKVDTAAVAGLAMPSDKYIDLTIGASGTKHTAPADGWFAITGEALSDKGVVALAVTQYGSMATAPEADLIIYTSVPILKGHSCTASFNFLKSVSLRFVYAVGSSPTV